MFRIDVPSAATALADPAAVGVPGYFTEGNAVVGQAATVVSADFLNMIQEELMAIVLFGGIVPGKSTRNQVLAALKASFIPLTAIGNIAGVTSVNTSLTISTVLNGWVIQTPTAGITLAMPDAATNQNKTFSFFNTSSGTITLSAGNFNSAVGSGVTSITIPSGETIGLTSDGTSWNAFSGSLAAGAPVKPQAASGIGQWALVLTTTNLMYLPSGGTWAYFAANNGIGYAGILGGGSSIFSGTLNNAFGFCWRIA